MLDDENPRIVYTAEGGETEFEFPWLVYTDANGGSSHLKVIRLRDDVATDLVVTTNYTVSGLDAEAGGSITLTEAAEEDDIYILYRELPIETFFTFAQGGDYFADSVNKQNNLMLQVLQQLRMQLGRGATLPPESPLNSIELPLPVALLYLRWNAAANALENVDPPESGSIGNGQLANMAQATIKGRASGAGTGAPQDLTPAQAIAVLGTNVLQQQAVASTMEYSSAVLADAPGLSISFTPKSAASFLLIEVSDALRAQTDGENAPQRQMDGFITLADNTVISSGRFGVSAEGDLSDSSFAVKLSAIVAAGSISARTYKVRYEPLGSECEVFKGEATQFGVIKVTELIAATINTD
jgi:hypothetical protein